VVGYRDLVDSDCCHSHRYIFLCFTADSFSKDDNSCDSTGTCGRAFSSTIAGSYATGFAIPTAFTKADTDSQTGAQSYTNA